MKTLNAPQQLILHAVFMNSPMLNIAKAIISLSWFDFRRAPRANNLNSGTYSKSRQTRAATSDGVSGSRSVKQPLFPFGTLIKKITSLNITKAFRPTFLAVSANKIRLNVTRQFTAISYLPLPAEGACGESRSHPGKPWPAQAFWLHHKAAPGT